MTDNRVRRVGVYVPQGRLFLPGHWTFVSVTTRAGEQPVPGDLYPACFDEAGRMVMLRYDPFARPHTWHLFVAGITWPVDYEHRKAAGLPIVFPPGEMAA